jgi:proteasome lid subunit RPN8/RPN11
MPVAIAADLLERLLNEARADPAREICGLLFGGGDRIEAARSTRNVAADPRDSFEIDPADLFMAIRQERGGGPCLIGHYHSHPSGLAEPSARDLAAAESGKLWLIIAGGTARLWRAVPGRFDEVEMAVNRGK